VDRFEEGDDGRRKTRRRDSLVNIPGDLATQTVYDILEVNIESKNPVQYIFIES
jgi:hypothetical protein